MSVILPLDLLEISLLLAIIALVLLVTSELLSPRRRKANILIDKKRIRNAAIAFSVLFVVAIGVRILTMIM